MHSENRLLTVKRLLLLLKDLLLEIVMRGNLLTFKGVLFKIISFYCQSISFGLEMKSFIVQRKYNFKDNGKIV